jgi:hypothetical protein
MFRLPRLFRRNAATITAAQTLGQRSAEVRAAKARQDREKVRAMANQLRADMRAKGHSDLPEIDWSTLK